MKKKNQTIYLVSVIFLGLRAKFISLLSKIIMNRELGVEAMGLFSLVNPFIVLLISLSNLSLPSAIATLISKNPKKDKLILISGFSIFTILSIGLMLITFLCDNFIATSILKNKDAIYCIRASLIMIPLTGLSALIKGYFLGKGEISLTSSSQTYEEAGRLLFIILIVMIYKNSIIPIKASFAVYSLAFGEIFQISYMVFFSSINKQNIIPSFKRHLMESRNEIRPLLNISIPLTLSRLVGSITYFFEPIIFTRIMLNNGSTLQNLTIEYGILSSYVMPLLFMPSFISVAFGNYLLPNMGNLVSSSKHKDALHLLFKITIICLFIGLFISIFFLIFGKILLQFLYGNTLGLEYLKILCFPFIIYYIETPIISSLNIYDLSKKSFISTLISSIIRLVLMIPLVKYFGVLGISFATIIGVIIDISLNLFFLFFFFKRNKIKIID